jgi:hypothetical protein
MQPRNVVRVMKLRCRLGWHAWSRFQVRDPTVASSDVEWETRCRHCGKRRRTFDIPVGGGGGGV